MSQSEGFGECSDCGGKTWYIYSRSHAAATACKDEVCMFCGLCEHMKAKPGDNTEWELVEHRKSHLALEAVNSERSDWDMLPLQELCRVNESALNIAIWESEAEESLDNWDLQAQNKDDKQVLNPR